MKIIFLFLILAASFFLSDTLTAQFISPQKTAFSAPAESSVLNADPGIAYDHLVLPGQQDSDQCRKARQINTAGTILTVAGAGAILVGTLIATSGRSTGATIVGTIVGGPIAIAGVVAAAVGVPVLITGSNRKRTYCTTSVLPRIENTENGTGIVYNF